MRVRSTASPEQHDLAQHQEREHAIRKQARRVSTALLADARIGRHEGGIEGAFRKDRTEMIGQAQGHEEGIGDWPGAEHSREHDVARKPCNTRQKREAADRKDASDHRPALHVACGRLIRSMPAAPPR
jgi:hypothetical protein